ncbi:uncharacterized protein BXZ73DRAFT_73604 [Epithele typhae]|uniref:uncharacterized protein n=1 Tax=Epithele typhae TaxID=378194 RepID=UPI0020088793|nr:uncharacterized protein BXZ73DRAFT_73604 [Epithele typhae]KAH9945459.1 hypothetical protein BXZ73DRAFT_73604 [Epithele typhae]
MHSAVASRMSAHFKSQSVLTATAVSLLALPTSSAGTLGIKSSTSLSSEPFVTAPPAPASEPPTQGAIVDTPNPSSDASKQKDERSRFSSLLAVFMILGALVLLGISTVCLRCGVPGFKRILTRRKRNTMTERTIEEGFRDISKFIPPHVVQKKTSFLVPSHPPIVTGSSRTGGSASSSLRLAPTLAYSSRPPDSSSLQAVHGGVYGSVPSRTTSWITEEGFEDVTHILSASTFAASRVSDSSTSSVRLSVASVNSTRLSRHVSAGRRFTPSSSRASQGAVSVYAQSYTTCESRYSTPSIGAASTVSAATARATSPSSASGSNMDAGPSTSHSSADSFHSPESGSSSSRLSSCSSGSASLSDLPMTPPQPEYQPLHHAAQTPSPSRLPVYAKLAPIAEEVLLPHPVSRRGVGRGVALPDWRTLPSAPSTRPYAAPKIPLPPLPAAAPVRRGRADTLRPGAPLAMGSRTVVLMRGS